MLSCTWHIGSHQHDPCCIIGPLNNVSTVLVGMSSVDEFWHLHASSLPVQRLNKVLIAGMQQSGQVLSVLVNLKSTAENFTTELQQNLAGVDALELQQIAAAVYLPFESQIAR